MLGIRRPPGALIKTDGEGDDSAPPATWNGRGILNAATIEGPESSGDTGPTAANVVTVVSRTGLMDGAEAPTLTARTTGVSTAMPNTGLLTARPARRRTAARAAPPPLTTQPS